MEWGSTQWIFLHLVVPVTCSVVTVYQPPVLTSALGGDVVMPCHLSNNEKMVAPPVLYWVYSDNAKLWPSSEKYKERVDLLDKDVHSSNKSMLFKNVQWADSGKYLCKLSIMDTDSNKRSRVRGNETLLMIYDNMIFNLTSHNDSLLWCEVNVTRDPGFVLSIFHDGQNSRSVDSPPGNHVAALPFVTLSETISFRGGGKYECQLHLNKHLITKSVFHYRPPELGDADKNVSSLSEPGDVVVFPEPWLLHVPLLLVPIAILLCLITAWLKRRSSTMEIQCCQRRRETSHS